mmetsp:Transcript_102222/g.181517  ORF Transcript_102222/g.181517 Transcript_102222/m.181517 type:complete len:90 (+) Transcript_102222:196-465(+)
MLSPWYGTRLLGASACSSAMLGCRNACEPAPVKQTHQRGYNVRSASLVAAMVDATFTCTCCRLGHGLLVAYCLQVKVEGSPHDLKLRIQ